MTLLTLSTIEIVMVSRMAGMKKIPGKVTMKVTMKASAKLHSITSEP